MQSAVIPTAIPSVFQSVSLLHASTLSRGMKGGSCGLHCEVGNTLYSFVIPTMVGGRRPLPPKICAQNDTSHSEMRPLRPISAYNVSTVRAIEKSSRA